MNIRAAPNSGLLCFKGCYANGFIVTAKLLKTDLNINHDVQVWEGCMFFVRLMSMLKFQNNFQISGSCLGENSEGIL